MKSSSNALDPTLGFKQYLEYLLFLKYILGLNMNFDLSKIPRNILKTFEG